MSADAFLWYESGEALILNSESKKGHCNRTQELINWHNLLGEIDSNPTEEGAAGESIKSYDSIEYFVGIPLSGPRSHLHPSSLPPPSPLNTDYYCWYVLLWWNFSISHHCWAGTDCTYKGNYCLLIIILYSMHCPCEKYRVLLCIQPCLHTNPAAYMEFFCTARIAPCLAHQKQQQDIRTGCPDAFLILYTHTHLTYCAPKQRCLFWYTSVELA